MGVCSAGTQTCQSGALQCVQNVQPSAEICNGLDDDCDGTCVFVKLMCSQLSNFICGISVDESNPQGGGSCSTGTI